MSVPGPRLTTPVALWDMLGPALPRGVLGLSDPDVHLVNRQWTMFVGGFSTTFRNRLYRATLPNGAPLTLTGWRLDTGPQRRARPLVEDPHRAAWDAGGMHTPSYVPPAHGFPARIYYAGRGTRRRYGPGSNYSIGVLTQREEGTWARHPRPVLSGTAARPSVLEPRVIAAESGFRMWFLSTPHEVGPGEQPDFELWVSESADGLTWRGSRRFSTGEEGFFDNTVVPTEHGWEMFLARGTNLHGTDPFPAQGLWWMRAEQPSAHRSDWSTPQRILDTDASSTARWLAQGVCGPSVAVEGSLRLAFLAGTYRSRPWLLELVSRLLSHRRPAVPAPYYLASGGARLNPSTAN
ncbi:hypothetical protein [Blastococcus sp. Marseille-P5729]|uniref:hypothetical protein n=1 Tax=Blastococcus sp. Marseille-P5729 TaxID=2086582 RepID=UPI000D10BB3D|nr:hypothetical protein [Blastococcus sp. Marseille-P5729]